MTDAAILSRLAPCGLHCGQCFAFVTSDIHRLSNDLQHALGNFGVYAERFTDLLDEPLFLKYPPFREMLAYFAKGSCQGCRKQTCAVFKGCRVKACAENNGVDFCFQCTHFPCQKTGFDTHLQKRWETINRRMQTLGVEVYYESIKDEPRY